MTALKRTEVRRTRESNIVAALTCLGLLLLLVVPPSLLDVLGLAYISPDGSAWEKIHPGTFVLVLAFAMAAAQSGHIFRYAEEKARRFPGVAVFFAAVLMLAVYLMAVQKAPFTPLIDTFIMPILLFLLLVDLPDRGKGWIEWSLHLFVMVNALLGIAEYLGSWRLIPATFNGQLVTPEMDWRASGLLGHPLTSSAMAGLYAVVMALGGGRRLPSWLRAPAIALQLVALAAYGGRTALVFSLALIGLAILYRMFGLLRGRRFDPMILGVCLLAAPVALLGMAALAGSGFFDQLLSRFVEDNGSAEARSIIFNLFSYLSWQELWLGPDQDHLATILHFEGIEVGVESFWLGMIFLCGICMSTLFFIGLGCFMVHVMRQTEWRAMLPLLFYTAVISTSVSLSSKSTTLGTFIAIVMILMPARVYEVVREPIRLRLTQAHA